MARAELRLTVPEGVWVGDLSREYDDVRFRVLAALPDGETGVGLAEVTGDDLDALLGAVREADAVASLDVLQRRDRTALVQFETTTPLLLLAVRDSGVPLEMPFDIVDGEATWTVTAPRDRLSALGTQLEASGVPFTVDAVTEDVDQEAVLTRRQAALLEAAVDRGYYDTPRRCTLRELAADLDMAKSTCSETLHRAEERVVKRFLEVRDREPTLGTQS